MLAPEKDLCGQCYVGLSRCQSMSTQVIFLGLVNTECAADFHLSIAKLLCLRKTVEIVDGSIKLTIPVFGKSSCWKIQIRDYGKYDALCKHKLVLFQSVSLLLVFVCLLRFA